MRDIVFGFGGDTGIEDPSVLLRAAVQADEDGLDLVSVADHPYIGGNLDAYSAIGFLLGRTRQLAGLVNVTNLPTRPAPMLSRAVTSLSALSGGRVVLGMGAGGRLGRIATMGVPLLTPGAAVEAFEEAIVLVKALSGGGRPVTFEGRHYRVDQVEPAPVPAPAVWTGSVGPRSLAVTGRVADGWIPGHAADWLSERYRTSRLVIDEAAAAGRDPGEIRTIFNFPGAITERPLAATRDRDGRWVGGSVDQWVEELTGAVLDHGASGFTLFSPGGGEYGLTALRRWGLDIAPAIREAVEKERAAA
ncbi:LLM class flavin-dependent oxidoreductase [Pseudonocardia sp. TRM90224]|uniref:LLM class flavin-dependent oxidoreductase n=1 Tax=Pseudonocardia sp. TRM90224 TaxID=2812678 RepID=UPI001E422587|nr:LLM class flavin-dependent oxidoreductase [Pseudonocardia sp. TRM90224]